MLRDAAEVNTSVMRSAAVRRRGGGTLSAAATPIPQTASARPTRPRTADPADPTSTRSRTAACPGVISR